MNKYIENKLDELFGHVDSIFDILFDIVEYRKKKYEETELDTIFFNKLSSIFTMANMTHVIYRIDKREEEKRNGKRD